MPMVGRLPSDAAWDIEGVGRGPATVLADAWAWLSPGAREAPLHCIMHYDGATSSTALSSHWTPHMVPRGVGSTHRPSKKPSYRGKLLQSSMS